MDKGIDTDSPLFQAILENPVVQLGLTNPKTLLGKTTLFLSQSTFCRLSHLNRRILDVWEMLFENFTEFSVTFPISFIKTGTQYRYVLLRDASDYGSCNNASDATTLE